MAVPTAELKSGGWGLRCQTLKKFRCFVAARLCARQGTVFRGGDDYSRPISASNERAAVQELLALLRTKLVDCERRLEFVGHLSDAQQQRQSSAAAYSAAVALGAHRAACLAMASTHWRSVRRVLNRHICFLHGVLRCEERFGLPGAHKPTLLAIAEWLAASPNGRAGNDKSPAELDASPPEGFSLDMAAALLAYVQAWPVGLGL